MLTHEIAERNIHLKTTQPEIDVLKENLKHIYVSSNEDETIDDELSWAKKQQAAGRIRYR